MKNLLVVIFSICLVGGMIYTDRQISELSTRLDRIEKKLGGPGKIACNEKDTIAKVRQSVVRIVGGESEGSGYAFQPGGLILTNFHVIETESNPKVVFPDNTFETGLLLMADKDSDLAVIQVQRDLPPLRSAKYRTLNPADELIAIGYPLGGGLPGESSIIRGVFSRFVSDKTTHVKYVQTDMTFVEGISGGPMVNIYGEAVGINTSGLLLGGMGLAISSESIIDKYRLMSAAKDPLKDVKETVFLPEKSPLEAVRAFYNYLKTRRLEKAYGLLSDNFLKGGSFEKWSKGYQPLLDTTILTIGYDKEVKDRVKVKLSTKDLVGDEIVYKFFEGYWDVKKENGKWMLWHPRIKEVKDPPEEWSYDQDFISSLEEFAKDHEDVESYAKEMFRISQEPGNAEMSMQELYDEANKIGMEEKK
jgi:hypothetical protein